MKLDLIKRKDFSLLILGKLVSLLGSNMQQFALSLYVLGITGSATIFASMLSISILPRLLLSPIAGVFGDWFDRKKSIVFLDLINSLIIGIFAWIFIVEGSLSIPMIYILVILLEITEVFFGSAMAAVIPSIVEKEELLEANSFNSLVMNIGNILAPILAAALYGAFGLKVVLIMNSISFLLSAISEMFINIPKNNKRPEKVNLISFKKDLMEGIKIIRENKMISTMIGLGTIINFSAAPLFSVGLIFILKEILKVSDFQFGIAQMTLSLSMVMAPVLCGGIINKVEMGKLIHRSFFYVSLLILIMAIIPMGLYTNISNINLMVFILLLVLSFGIGAIVTLANISLGALFDQIVPLEVMGRASSVFNLAVTVFIPIGQMIFGFLYDTMIPSVGIAISGIVMLIAITKYKPALIENDGEVKAEVRGDIIDEF